MFNSKKTFKVKSEKKLKKLVKKGWLINPVGCALRFNIFNGELEIGFGDKPHEATILGKLEGIPPKKNKK